MLALIRFNKVAIISYLVIYFVVLTVYYKVPQFNRLTKLFSPAWISVGISNEKHNVSNTRAIDHI